MNTNRSYEDEIRNKLEQVPLAPVERAWEDMRRKLDDEDRRSGWFTWRTGLFILAFLLAVLTVSLMMHHQQHEQSNLSQINRHLAAGINMKEPHQDGTVPGTFHNAESASRLSGVQSAGTRSMGGTDTLLIAETNGNQQRPDGVSVSEKKDSHSSVDRLSDKKDMEGTASAKVSGSMVNGDYTHRPDNRGNPTRSAQRQRKNKQQQSWEMAQGVEDNGPGPDDVVKRKRQVPGKQQSEISYTAGKSTEKADQSGTFVTQQEPVMEAKAEMTSGESSISILNAIKAVADSGKNEKKADSTSTVTKTRGSIEVKDSRRKKTSAWHFSAYAGIKQSVPVGGQQIKSYGFNGKKGIFPDYIPSLHIRAERFPAWFVQLDLSFASPQYDDGFSYFRKTDISHTSHQLTTMQFYLEKAYYHEALLGIHYRLGKGFVAGGGIGWDQLFRSVTTRTVTVKDIQSEEVTSKRTVTTAAFVDSFMYSAKATGFLQVMYERKKWSAGIRAKMDIQPYIKYTTPEGEVRQRQYQSLDILFRYRFWKSRKGL